MHTHAHTCNILTLVCIKYPAGMKCSWRRGCRVKFKKSCKRIGNPLCYARNVACKGMKRTIQGSIWVVQRTVRASSRVLSLAKVASRVARAAISSVRYIFYGFQRALQTVKRLYRLGVQAFTAIVNFGLGGIINIREVSFNVALGAAMDGKFTARIRISFFGRPPVNVHSYINLKNIGAMVKNLVSRAIR